MSQDRPMLRRHAAESAASTGFTAYVTEQLGWYVYLLRDPRDGEVFYVGKGRGNRVFAHQAHVEEGRSATLVAEDGTSAYIEDEPEVESAKNQRIRAILDSGHRVEHLIVRHKISSETAAYDLEAAVLDTVSAVRPQPALTNVAGGHHIDDRGLMSAEVAVSVYEAPPAPEITEPAMLFRIPRLWTPAMSSEELFEATRGWWRVDPRRAARARFALGVSKGVIRGVYRIDHRRPRRQGDRDWQHDPPGKPRWGFEGAESAEPANLLNTSVRHLYRKGDRSQFRYFNC